jgi:hypothetical protein
MWKAALAGALALAMGTISAASAQQYWSGNAAYQDPYSQRGAPYDDSYSRRGPAYDEHRSQRGPSYQDSNSQQGPLVTEAHIAGLKSALRLTPEQHPYWGPVESALRSLARHQRRDSSAGFVQRMSDRASAMAGTAMALRRLASASRPLMRSLSDEQKSSGMQIIRRYGFERLMAAF